MIGLFGKTSAHGDFIKLNASAPVVSSFAQWLNEGVQLLGQANVGFPSTPVGFLYSDSSQREVLVGAFVRSQDKVGREFPLSIFAMLDARVAATIFPLVPSAYDAFLNEVVGILLGAQGLDVSALGQRMAILREPSQSDLSAAEATSTSELNAYTMGEFQQQFGALGQGHHYYAFHAVLSACESLRGSPPPTSGIITLECPIASATMSMAWLQLTKRALKWHVSPSFFWTSDESRRLLLSLGSPPPAVMKYIVGADPNAAKLWPLRTTSDAAILAAHKALDPNLRASIDTPQNSFSHVLSTIA